MKRLLVTALAVSCGWTLESGYSADIEGTVHPSKSVTVSVPVQGILDEVTVEEGDVVKKGDAIASLESEREALDLDRYKVVVEQAKKEFESAERLAKKSLGTQIEAAEKKTELQRFEAEEKMAAARLRERKVFSPISGIIVMRFKDPGEAVEATEEVVEVINIDTVYLQFHLGTEFLQKLKKGDSFQVTFPELPDEAARTATVDFLDPRVDSASGLFRVRLIMENPDWVIKSGLRAKADFTKPLALAQ